MSNVRCEELDTDLTKCKKSEGEDKFLHSCTHANDVGLKCYDVSWSGIRLGKKIEIFCFENCENRNFLF